MASRYKQSSLDSKIDDILEVSSAESDLPGRTSEGTDTFDLDRDLEALKVSYLSYLFMIDFLLFSGPKEITSVFS